MLSFNCFLYYIDMHILEKGMMCFSYHTEHITIEVLQVRVRGYHYSKTLLLNQGQCWSEEIVCLLHSMKAG